LAVRAFLGDVWGDELPPSPDPWLTLTQDALAADDQEGRAHGFLVYADAVHLDVLIEVVSQALRSHPCPMSTLARLPTALREQVHHRLLSPS
jgi:hypothetical protein